MEDNYNQIPNSQNLVTENQNNQITNIIRSEKIITRKGIIITCILLFFVSIFLDLYLIYLTDIKLYMKVLLCIIHPLLFIIFLFIPSGLYVEFNYSENKFIYHKTCILPFIWNKCTRNEVDLNNIEKFRIETSKFLWFRNFRLFYEDKQENSIKITSGRDRNCVKSFSFSVLNIPVKLNCWLKNQDFFEQSIMNEEKPIGT